MPAPFHAIARGFAGPSLLAMILVDKYAIRQPLTRARLRNPGQLRRDERYAKPLHKVSKLDAD